MKVALRPSTIDRYRLTVPVSVTALTRGSHCMARIAFEAGAECEPADDNKLPSDPRADLGGFLHDVVEAGITYQATPAELQKWVKEQLEARLANAGRSDLKDMFSRKEWRERRSVAISALALQAPVEVLREVTRPSPLPLRSGDFAPRPPRPGREVAVVSPDSRVKGRMDRLEYHGDHWRIVEMKTGRIFNNAQEVYAQYQLQTDFYAWMVKAHYPDAVVYTQLVGRDGRSERMRFGSSGTENVLRALSGLEESLAKGQWVGLNSSAAPGPGCRGCMIRHRCSNYIGSAPMAWVSDVTDDRWPFDVWGEVERIEEEPRGLMALELRVSSTYKARVSGVPVKAVGGLVKRGKELSFFNLKAKVSASGRQPRNYFVLARRAHESSHTAIMLHD